MKRDGPTAEQIEKILNVVRVGASREVAAESQDIPLSRFYDWLKQGATTSSGACHELLRGLRRAEAERHILAVSEIIKIGRGGQVSRRKSNTTVRKNGDRNEITDESFTPPQWTAIAWFLERRWPQWWAKVSRELADGEIEEDELARLATQLAPVLTQGAASPPARRSRKRTTKP